MKKLLILLGLMISNQVLANYMVSPLSHSIDLESKSRTRVFTVENSSKKEVLVEMELFEKVYKTDESDRLEKIPHKKERKLFKIYPRIVKVKPNQKKSVVVKWIGDSDIPEGKLYTIVASQKELKKEPAKIGATIKFMFNYNLAISVNPKKTIKKVKVESFEYVESKKAFKIKFKNDGNSPISTTKLSLLMEKKEGDKIEKKETFKREELSGFNGKVIFPGKTRYVYLNAPEGFQRKDVEIKIFE
jgi:P pilus assembly chaperone PapD